MKSKSLFDTRETWLSDPEKAFDAFMQSDEFQELGLRRPKPTVSGESKPEPKPLRSSSIKVYRSMWGKWLRWLVARNIALFEVSSADLMSFLERTTLVAGKVEKELNSRIKHKYLRIFERVYIHLRIEPNPARHQMFEIFKSGHLSRVGTDAPLAALSEMQQRDFMTALPQPASPQDWKRRRDRAMQAIMLGAGLRVNEVVGLRVENVGVRDSTGSIPISISPASVGGTARWHQTQLRPFAVFELQLWIEERRKMHIPGLLLFPANINGGPLDKATVYRQVKATFKRAGIDVPRLGGRTLRNSFAVRELKSGESIELVGEFMGHRKRRSTEYYLATDC